MAVLDRIRPSSSAKSSCEQNCERGRARHRTWQPVWAEQQAFFEGRQFVWRNRNGTLSERRTEFDAKEEYRSRLVRNRIFKIVNAEVSAGTNRAPSYEVVPSKPEDDVIAAAKLAEKALLHLYDFLSLRRKFVNCYRYAVVTGEGFIRPYWNPTVGNPLPKRAEDEKQLYEGELACEVLGPEAVYWEPGLSFEESPWHAIERPMSPVRIKQLDRLKVDVDRELKSDQATHASFVQGQLSKKSAKADSVLVTEYLEKPTPDEPEGIRVFLANGKEITERDEYPTYVTGPDGPEPCLVEFSYVETPDRDRDMGLVEHLIDPQRSANFAMNRENEWMNAAMMPQVITGPGGMIDPLTNEPFAVFRAKGDVNQVKFRETPTIPPQLAQHQDRAYVDMEYIAAQNSPTGADQSGRHLALQIEQDQSVRAHIVQNWADFHGRVGRHLLALMQRYYTEQRLRSVEGRIGWGHIHFKGADLRGQLDVRVLPASIEPVTKQAVERKVMLFVSWGAITKEAAMAALNGGTAEGLVRSYEQDIERIGRICMKIREWPVEAILTGEPSPIDEETGESRPGWMPRPFDNVDIQIPTMEDWLKSADYDYLPIERKAIANLVYKGLKQEQATRRAQEAMAQQQMAEGLGMQNAAAPQLPKSLPDQPGLELKSPDLPGNGSTLI